MIFEFIKKEIMKAAQERKVPADSAEGADKKTNGFARITF